MTNLDIAQAAKIEPIQEPALRAGLLESDFEPIGRFKGKLTSEGVQRLLGQPPKGKLILVTAINPTPSGEGKTTMSVGLAQGLQKIGKNAAPALREPALGPVFGVKGGACGGGYSQVLPMEEINLFFNGDFPAITSAHNLLAAMVDASLHHGNPTGLDLSKIWWPRTVDMIDRSMREIIVGLGKGNGPVRTDGFVITPASEVMAAFCLASSLTELRSRLERIAVGLRQDGKPVTAAEIGGVGAMMALLRDAFRPNIVQTIEGGLAFVHGGPFGNIAHGCSSVAATQCALRASDYVVTEGGFGSDLGGQKFLDLVVPIVGVQPSAIVLVATVRALKHHGGGNLAEGRSNLGAHIRHLKQYGPAVTVAINKFADDSDADLADLIAYAADQGANAVVADPWGSGGQGCTSLAEAVSASADQPSSFSPLFASDAPIEDKLQALTTKVYGGESVEYAAKAKKALEWLRTNGYGSLPVCVAKTQYSLSDDPTRLGAPSGFNLHVQDVKLSAGAGFVVAICGDILLMPGMGKTPAAARIDVKEDGSLVGMF